MPVITMETLLHDIAHMARKFKIQNDDIVVELKENMTLTCHKTILLEIPYFERLVSFKDKNVVNLSEDLPFEGFGHLVRFAYIAKLMSLPDASKVLLGSLDKSNWEDVLFTANYLQYDGPVNVVVQYLKAEIAKDPISVLNYIYLPHHFCLNECKVFLEDYCGYYFRDIVQSELFSNADITTVQELTAIERLRIDSEDEVFLAVVRWIRTDKSSRLKYLDQEWKVMKNVRLADVSPSLKNAKKYRKYLGSTFSDGPARKRWYKLLVASWNGVPPHHEISNEEASYGDSADLSEFPPPPEWTQYKYSSSTLSNLVQDAYPSVDTPKTNLHTYDFHTGQWSQTWFKRFGPPVPVSFDGCGDRLVAVVHLRLPCAVHKFGRPEVAFSAGRKFCQCPAVWEMDVQNNEWRQVCRIDETPDRVKIKLHRELLFMRCLDRSEIFCGGFDLGQDEVEARGVPYPPEAFRGNPEATEFHATDSKLILANEVEGTSHLLVCNSTKLDWKEHEMSDPFQFCGGVCEFRDRLLITGGCKLPNISCSTVTDLTPPHENSDEVSPSDEVPPSDEEPPMDEVPPMPRTRRDHGVVVHEEQMYVIGGRGFLDGDFVAEVNVYDFAKREWRTMDAPAFSEPECKNHAFLVDKPIRLLHPQSKEK